MISSLSPLSSCQSRRRNVLLGLGLRSTLLSANTCLPMKTVSVWWPSSHITPHGTPGATTAVPSGKAHHDSGWLFSCYPGDRPELPVETDFRMFSPQKCHLLSPLRHKGRGDCPDVPDGHTVSVPGSKAVHAQPRLF